MSAINTFVIRARAWLGNATPAELWNVIQQGGMDANVGMPGLSSNVGVLSGPGSFLEKLQEREWAAGAAGDLAAWFASDPAAQAAARWEIECELDELFFDLGDWVWKGGGPGGDPPAPAL
jgi:hypothetical protein